MSNNRVFRTKRLGILLKGMIPSFLFLPFPTVKNRVVFSSTGNDHYNFNSKFLFEYVIRNRKDLSAFFVINDDLKREELNKNVGPWFIETKSFSGMWFVLRARFWFTSSMETPVGGILHRFKRTVVQLGHGAPLKNIGLLEKRISPVKRLYYKLVTGNFTKFLAVSEYFKPIIARFAGVSESRIIVSEQPRNAALTNQSRNIIIDSIDKKRILYAPTWKPWSSLDDWGMLKGDNFEILDDFLKDMDTVLFLRMHPYFESSRIYDKVKKSQAMKVLSTSIVPEINDALGAFDILITDYSSLFFDYLLLDRPILFWTEDISKYEEIIGFVDSFDKLAAGPTVADIKELMSILKNIIVENKTYEGYRKSVMRLLETDRRNVCGSLLEKAGL